MVWYMAIYGKFKELKLEVTKLGKKEEEKNHHCKVPLHLHERS